MLIRILTNSVLSLFFLLLCSFTNADLVAMEDADLGEVDGEGIGVVLEDFVYNAGEQVNGGTFEITGLSGRVNGGGQQNVVLGISQFYIAGQGSNNGSNVDNNPVTLGRLNYPFNIELVDGDNVGVPDKAVFEFAAPKKAIDSSYFNFAMENRSEGSGQRVDRISGFNTNVLSSRTTERADMGIRFDLEIGGSRFQSLENHIESLAIDGSYTRLWGDSGHMEGELAVNLYTPSIEFFACDAAGNNCGATVDFQNVAIEAELGYGEAQPVTFEVGADGNFIFEVGSLQGRCGSLNGTGGCSDAAGRAFFNDYYQNGPKGNIYIGNVSVGGRNYGSSTISNLQIQYLEVKSHDL